MSAALAVRGPRMRWGLLLPVLFLLSMGLATIHTTSGSSVEGAAVHGPGTAPIADEGWLAAVRDAAGQTTFRQWAFVLTGVGLLALVAIPSYQWLGRYAYLAYAVVMALLLLLALDRWLEPFGIDVPFVPVRRATRRWIEFGAIGIQPSEFMKVALVLCLARYLRYREDVQEWRGLIKPFALTALPMVLIHFQPDLGTLLMLLPILFAMLWVAGAKKRHLAVVLGAGMVAAPFFYAFVMRDYQRVRVDVVLRQETADERWHRREGYQLRQAKAALGTGGVTGAGFGQGLFVTQDALLPERHNDFIFAMIGHQFGLLGAGAVILAYLVFAVVGAEVAGVTNDPFGRLIAVGLTVMIVAQGLLNIAMIVGLIPITGVTLPFVSYGGSSIWAGLIALGLLLNIERRRPLMMGRAPTAFDREGT